MHPLVTIILPTYNRAAYIERAIRSVLNQTYNNWELLIIDDGSTDTTASIVETFLTTDKRINYIKLNENKGVCFARNTGIKQAKGEYVTFLDSDDEYFPQKLELQVKCFLSSDIENVGVVSCGREDVMDGKKYLEWIPKYRGHIVDNILKKDRVGAQTPFMMIKRHLLVDNEIYFDLDLPSGEEWDLLLRVCLLANFDFVPKPLVRVHQHNGDRVYTSDRGLIAFEKQYNKYKHLLIKKKQVHDLFVLRMAAQRYVYGYPNKALDLLSKQILNKNINTMMWRVYIRSFPKFGNIPSRVFYKLMKYISYN